MIGPDSHVVAPLATWEATEGVVLISPAMAAAPRGPRFTQYLALVEKGSRTTGTLPGVERLLYVLSGSVTLDGEALDADGFAFLPADSDYELTSKASARLLVFEKPYHPQISAAAPPCTIGTLANAPSEPFHGDPDAVLSTLLPTDAPVDMAVNVFTYQPGANLPLVETHVMEHGLWMRSGAGVYRLGDSWYPVAEGDAIWMAAYCPQWFVAMGKCPASYIYYKDINRHPLMP
jgi:(S)-ureidoglycine aminohydrolase